MKKIAYVVTISETIRAFFIPQLRFLADHGLDVTVICSPDPNLQQALGDKIRFLPVEIPRGVSVGGSLRTIKALKEIFRREKFDLIQYSTANAAFYSSIAAKKTGCPVRNHHMMGFRYLGLSGMGRRVMKRIETITCRNSTHIECVSKSNRELGIREGIFPAEKSVVLLKGSTGGLDTARFDCARRDAWRREIRKELGLAEDVFVYGFVGRITRDKGINELLEAFMGLNNHAKLLLVGPMNEAGTLDPALLEKAKKHPDILFHGAVADVERYYAALDVLVLPSYREGLGMVAIEAEGMGTPVIASRIPGLVDAVDETAAVLVPAKDMPALREAMRGFPERDYRGMGEAAARFAKESFDSRLLFEKILERKRSLLGMTEE